MLYILTRNFNRYTRLQVISVEKMEVVREQTVGCSLDKINSGSALGTGISRFDLSRKPLKIVRKKRLLLEVLRGLSRLEDHVDHMRAISFDTLGQSIAKVLPYFQKFCISLSGPSVIQVANLHDNTSFENSANYSNGTP